MLTDSPQNAAPLPRARNRASTTRSKVTNSHAQFLGSVDGRSEVARRYRDICTDLVAHLGNSPSATEDAIIKRCATLIVWAEQAESELAGGGSIDIGQYTTAVNSLRRLLTDIGLEGRLKDVTPSLREMALRAQGSEAE